MNIQYSIRYAMGMPIFIFYFDTGSQRMLFLESCREYNFWADLKKDNAFPDVHGSHIYCFIVLKSTGCEEMQYQGVVTFDGDNVFQIKTLRRIR